METWRVTIPASPAHIYQPIGANILCAWVELGEVHLALEGQREGEKDWRDVWLVEVGQSRPSGATFLNAVQLGGVVTLVYVDGESGV